MWIRQTELLIVRWNSLCRNLMASLANGNLWMCPPPCKYCRNDLLSYENKAIMFWKQKWCFQEIAGNGLGSHKQWNCCLTCLYGCQSSVWSSAVFRVDGLWQTLLLKPLRHTLHPQRRGRGWGRNGSHHLGVWNYFGKQSLCWLHSDLTKYCHIIWMPASPYLFSYDQTLFWFTHGECSLFFSYWDSFCFYPNWCGPVVSALWGQQRSS